MQKDGVTFTNYFVTDSLCCPSRSSIFTGRYPHNTGIYRNVGPDGGYLSFRRLGNEATTFATVLTAAGYRTAMLGKYLNGYFPARHPPSPGWSFWAVGGPAYANFNYNLNQDGRLVHYGGQPADYLTDVVAGLGGGFIKDTAARPFLIEIATFAPHAPYTPAPRDAQAMPGLTAPRGAAFDAAAGADAPQWLRSHPALSSADIARIDAGFRKRAQAVLAIDRMLGALRAELASLGKADDTYVVFSSDNGLHMGEHRLMPGKMTAFDMDIRVPLIVVGPSVPAGRTVDAMVENVDLAATFAELAGTTMPATIDGRSLVPLLRGDKVAGWRSVVLVEHHKPAKDDSDPDTPEPRSGNPPSYDSVRAARWVYVEYDTGEREYHDLAADPDELRNGFAALPRATQDQLHATVEKLRSCRGTASCAMAAQ
jgi:arylsulfatase A-like enzyme